MTKKKNGRILLCSLIAFFCFFLPCTVAASDVDWAAKIISIQGSVEAQKTSGHPWQQVDIDDTFVAGETIRVKTNSRATVVLASQAIIRLDQNSAITFSPCKKKKFSLLKLLSGAAHFFSHVPKSLEVHTPFVNASVEGTEFFMRVEKEHTLLSVFKGSVAATNQAGSLLLAGGQSAVASRGSPPEIKRIIRPRDAVQWTLSYPLIFDFSSSSFALRARDDQHEHIKNSLIDFQHGRMVEALNRLGDLPDTIQDVELYSYRAMLHLAVGQQQQAVADIRASLQGDPHDSDAYALKSIIAVINNDRENAVKYGEKAVTFAPESPAALLALSYARQASFQLEQALEAVNKAVNLTPENGLALARQAELQLASGALRPAIDSAQQAVRINPQLARAHSVLGFANLASFHISQATNSFQQAIIIDSTDYMARLGLGLAKIKQGKLTEGKRDIEIAASLDPGNSLIRSYLGKAFFEDKNTKLAMRQLEVAKELDPQDPTPWLYGALCKQSTNQPVAALADIQKSITLNDNRAVYRSQFLLDEDLAVRNVSLAQIYEDLGFQQLALVEGWKSLHADPANHSAHRFLADSYADLPRHNIARMSEQLQAQLLEPGNVLPVHSQLAEYQSFIANSAGAPGAGFNEYTPLFNRNRLFFRGSGIAGGNSILGDEIFQSGLSGRYSYSIGQYHYETDGFRDNNDQEKDIYHISAKVSLSLQTNVQAEFKHSDNRHGDLRIRFDPENYDPEERLKNRTNVLRLGLHHNFTPHSDLIASFIHWNEDALYSQPWYSSETDSKGYLTEVAHLLKFSHAKITYGMGHYDDEIDFQDTFDYPPFPPFIDEHDHYIRQTNAYLYTLLEYPTNVTWTIGGSADFFDKKDFGKDQFNPKLGVTWQPLPGTTLRIAAFRNMQRMLFTGQTIEPTQVAGFNQFFDEGEAVDSWRFGIGIDQKIAANLFTGAEFSRRDMEVPWADYTYTPAIFQESDWEETFFNAYIFASLHQNIAAKVELRHEHLERDPSFAGQDFFEKVTTTSLPLGIKFFHDCGFSAEFTATYVDQEGKFIDIMTLIPDSKLQKENFWVADASISYRLPGQRGVLAIEASNLFDSSFRFQDTDPSSPRIYPERLILARFSLVF